MQNTLSPDERRDAILKLLAADRRLPVVDLAERFATSEDSIRRDLRRLAADGLIRRVHGAVLPAVGAVPFEDREALDLPAKAAVADLAAGLLRDGQTVLVDGGTTTLAVMRALPKDRRLTIVTTSPPVALAVAGHGGITAIQIGGTVDPASRTVVGAAAVEAIRNVRADVCLLGLCSLDVAAGITANGYEEAQVKRALIDATATRIAVATADKIGTASPHLVGPASQIDHLVTNEAAQNDTTSEDRIAPFRDLGIQVHLA